MFSLRRIPLLPGVGIDVDGLAGAGVLGGLAVMLKLSMPSSRWWLVPVLAMVPIVAFFRDYDRGTVAELRMVVSPTDGRVLRIERLRDNRLGSDEWLRIAIFLSLLDVHITRTPAAGLVVEILKEKGGHVNAMTGPAEGNTSVYVLIETAYGRVAVVQRVGMIARRIVNRSRVGALVARGERCGLIRFGSRVDVYLPANADILVTRGQRVVGGVTTIARFAWSP